MSMEKKSFKTKENISTSIPRYFSFFFFTNLIIIIFQHNVTNFPDFNSDLAV